MNTSFHYYITGLQNSKQDSEQDSEQDSDSHQLISRENMVISYITKNY